MMIMMMESIYINFHTHIHRAFIFITFYIWSENKSFIKFNFIHLKFYILCEFFLFVFFASISMLQKRANTLQANYFATVEFSSSFIMFTVNRKKKKKLLSSYNAISTVFISILFCHCVCVCVNFILSMVTAIIEIEGKNKLFLFSFSFLLTYAQFHTF